MNIKLLVMDIDGTLTNGEIIYSEDGVESKSFSVKDGMGIKQVKLSGIKTACITGRSSNVNKKRCEELQIDDLFEKVPNKIEILNLLVEKYKIDFKEVAYVGDDINDIECLEKVGLSACPADAVKQVTEICNYVSSKKAGEGAIRDIIDSKILREVN